MMGDDEGLGSPQNKGSVSCGPQVDSWLFHKTLSCKRVHALCVCVRVCTYLLVWMCLCVHMHIYAWCDICYRIWFHRQFILLIQQNTTIYFLSSCVMGFQCSKDFLITQYRGIVFLPSFLASSLCLTPHVVSTEVQSEIKSSGYKKHSHYFKRILKTIFKYLK